MEKKVLISEPFVFKSSENDERILKVEFLHMWNGLEVYKCLSKYTNMKSNRLLFQPRNVSFNHIIYNIYEVLDERREFTEESLNFVMRGNFIKG